MMRTTEGEDRVSDLNIEIDRISELPEPIIHLIFGLMGSTKDVVRTQILSKNWKRLFDSYQTFDLDESLFRVQLKLKAKRRDLKRRRKEELERFKEYVEKSRTRLDRLECAEKFRLHARGFFCWQCMAGWIRAAIAKNVKELDIDTGSDTWGVLPIDPTQSSSITRLKIKGSPLHRLAAMKMCNLREISINFVGGFYHSFDVNAMKILEENCPLLEDLRLAYCRHLSHLQISSLNKLKMVVVESCLKVEHIKIVAPNLETFELLDDRMTCRLDLKCSKNLKNLRLISYFMSDSEFEDRISMFPLLEKLELVFCRKIEKSKICSLTLKSLTLKHCSNLDQFEVDAPNLHIFQYEGDAMDFPFVIAPRLSEVKLSLDSFHRRSNAEYLFCNLDGSTGFKLLVYTKQNMKIFEDPREDDLYETLYETDDCEIEIELTKSSSKVVKRFEYWLSDPRAKSLVVVSSRGELLKPINKLIIEREEKCSSRYFKGVKVSTLENVEKTSHVFRWRYRKRKPRYRKLSLFEEEEEEIYVQYYCHR